MTYSKRPTSKEYNVEYYGGYIDLVPDGNILGILKTQHEENLILLSSATPAKQEYRYAPEKWSLKEVVGHIMDSEWIFSYRALCFARGEQAPLPGMDQDQYMANANFTKREMSNILKEYHHLRLANLALFESFDETILNRSGVAFDYPFTVRSLLYMIAGHEQHHINVLKECYF